MSRIPYRLFFPDALGVFSPVLSCQYQGKSERLVSEMTYCVERDLKLSSSAHSASFVQYFSHHHVIVGHIHTLVTVQTNGNKLYCSVVAR